MKQPSNPLLHNAVLSAAIDYGGRHFIVVVYGDAEETKCGFDLYEHTPHVPPTHMDYRVTKISQQYAEPTVGVSDCVHAATLRIIGYVYAHRSRPFQLPAQQQQAPATSVAEDHADER